MKRRNFIQASGTLSLSLATLNVLYPNVQIDRPRKLLSFGICADVHKDLVPDADQRLKEFVKEANLREVDFIMQLGDFCTPKEDNRGFMDIFNTFRGPNYHTIGNHDMDGGYSKKDTVTYYGMKHRYYSFDTHQFHCVVLDATVGDSYPWTIDDEQVDWLKSDLESTGLPTIVFIHQPLERDIVSNADVVREVLEAPTFKGRPKVIACFMGHRHMDYINVINEIPYIEINSMSYFWLGKQYEREPTGAAHFSDFKMMRYFSRYQDSLFAMVEIFNNGEMNIIGKSSSFVDGLPEQRGYPFTNVPKAIVKPALTDRMIVSKTLNP